MVESVLQNGRWKQLRLAASTVPPGRWAIGVSGGADSVALLMLLCQRSDLVLHIAHLDHQTRGEESTGDARFVQELASRLAVSATIALRSDIEKKLAEIPRNPSARYRAARLELFKQVVGANELNGVILAHHADDQAETIFHRLLRGAGAGQLAGMSARSCIDGLRIVRPLLAIRPGELREFLAEIAQPWREDSSNRSSRYLRNQIRIILSGEAALSDSFLKLGDAAAQLRKWIGQHSPELEERIRTEALALLPGVLARHSAARWLRERGSPSEEINAGVCDRLIAMASDAASPARQHFPGGVLVRRKRGVIFADGVER